MKVRSLWVAIACLALLPACATHQPPLPPVGPTPGATASTTAGKGNLVVYSAWSCFNNYDTTDHSGYMIYAKDGKLVKWVPNFIEGDYTGGTAHARFFAHWLLSDKSGRGKIRLGDGPGNG